MELLIKKVYSFGVFKHCVDLGTLNSGFALVVVSGHPCVAIMFFMRVSTTGDSHRGPYHATEVETYRRFIADELRFHPLELSE